MSAPETPQFREDEQFVSARTTPARGATPYLRRLASGRLEDQPKSSRGISNFSFHHATAVVLLDPQQPRLRAASFAAGSCAIVSMQLIVVLSIMWGSMLPQCSVLGAACKHGQVCNLAMERCWPCGHGISGQPILDSCGSDADCDASQASCSSCVAGMCVGRAPDDRCVNKTSSHLVDGGWCNDGAREYLCPQSGLSSGNGLSVDSTSWILALNLRRNAWRGGGGDRGEGKGEGHMADDNDDLSLASASSHQRLKGTKGVGGSGNTDNLVSKQVADEVSQRQEFKMSDLSNCCCYCNNLMVTAKV